MLNAPLKVFVIVVSMDSKWSLLPMVIFQLPSVFKSAETGADLSLIVMMAITEMETAVQVIARLREDTLALVVLALKPAPV